MFSQRLRKVRKEKGITLDKLAETYNRRFDGHLNKGTLSMYENGKQEPLISVVVQLAIILDVSIDYITGRSDDEVPYQDSNHYPSPNITEDCTRFPVIGEIAAGYDFPAIEDWDGEAIDIPNSYLKGHSLSDFFVLKVKGNSMHPDYQNGDKVLILKQSTMDYSGQVGAVLYDSEYATLKRVEYKMGEDWMNLVPINPAFPPVRIVNEDLELCRVIGIPKLLIRSIN